VSDLLLIGDCHVLAPEAMRRNGWNEGWMDKNEGWMDEWMDKKDERLKSNFLPFHFMNPSA
jgi:hypothetical protein